MDRVREERLSAEDLTKVQSGLSRLEEDIETFSAALGQLLTLKDNAGATRALSVNDRGTIFETQQQRQHDAAQRASRDGETVSLGADETGVGWLHAGMIIAGLVVMSAAMAWGTHSRKNKFTAKDYQVAASTTRVARQSRRCYEGRSTPETSTCDVAFIAHPGSTLSSFALWLPESRPLQRWRASWWMIMMWPFTCLVSVWFMFISPWTSGPYMTVDRFEYKGIQNQVWLSRAMGYQFMIKALRRRIACGIKDAVRKADEAGVSVMGLGALNKAEFINRGGGDILLAFEPRRTRLVHGNTLTAAVVVENIKAAAQVEPTRSRRADSPRGYFGQGKEGGSKKRHCVFLTGATSKVGRAVALKLAMDGFDVVCCTSSDERFTSLQRELGPLILRRHLQPQLQHEATSLEHPARINHTPGRLLRSTRVDEGVNHRLWAVGKYDVTVRHHIPLGASAVVFAVPCPLEGYRPDISVVPGGIVRMDLSSCSPRRFHVLLPFDQLYACHAAALVHHRMGWDHHEVGKVDVDRMALTLAAANECGFTIASLPSTNSSSSSSTRYLMPGIATGRAFSDFGVGDDSEKIPGVDRQSVAYRQTGVGPTGHVLSLENSPRRAGSGTQARQNGLILPRPGHVQHSRHRRNDCRDADGIKSTVDGEIDGHGMDGSPVESVNTNSNLNPTSGSSCARVVVGGNGPRGLGIRPEEAKPIPDHVRVLVVGAGASGLSAAASLRARGEADVLILERSDSICGSWNSQYEGLHITTRRSHCGLPGWPVPREGFCGEGGSGDTELSAPGFVRYLESYHRRFDLDVVLNTEVLSAEREADGGREGTDGSRRKLIRVEFRRGETLSVIKCEHLIVAIGKNASPRMPPAVVQSIEGFSGEVLHSSRVSGLASRAQRERICIVGMGNSACDLAVALLKHGAGRVHIATRSAPPIIMRQWGPLSLEWVSRAVQYLPLRLIDQVLATFAAAKWGRGWREKIFPPGLRQTWQACAENRIPCIDKGVLVPALLSGRIQVHGPIDWANDRSLRFRYSGVVESFDTIILATGFTPNKGMINPDLLEEGLHGGVHTVGFNNGRALLPLRQIGEDAKRVARRIVPRNKGPK